jgi:hypothetical protein
MRTTARFHVARLTATLLAAALVSVPAHAQVGAQKSAVRVLDAKAARDLTRDRVWQVKRPRGPGYDFWSWKSDGSVCLHLGERTGNCADTGRWWLDGQRVCYELTWWGAGNLMKSGCFRIAAQGKGQFAWLTDNEWTMQEFTIAQ